jgi:hypothetical protein
MLIFLMMMIMIVDMENLRLLKAEMMALKMKMMMKV